MGDSTDYTRLHITPLSDALLTSIIPPSILPNARNISYHTLQTFDTPYGFIDLPAMDAKKLKTKLNGSILKGQKIKIESAKPKHEFIPEEPEVEKPKREKKKRKRDEIPGADIGERSVKRGWATPGATKDKRDRKDKASVKSKYTVGNECLFKTVLPANAAANVKMDKDKKKRRGKGRETIIHEFEKTTKYATFLRQQPTKKKGAREFVDGMGWVDEDGELIEPVRQSRRKPVEKTYRKDVTTKTKLEDRSRVLEDEMSTSGSSSEDSSSEDSSSEDETPVKSVLKIQTTPAAKEGTPSSDTSDTDSSSSSSDEDERPIPDPPSTLSTPIKSSRPASSSGLTIKIPDSALTSTPTTIHPLEAIFKRAISATTTISSDPSDPTKSNTSPKRDTNTSTAKTGFSFFAPDNDEDVEDEEGDKVPLTPFTKQDFEYRGLRSAAPTPDTAFANKRFWGGDDDDDDEDSDSEPKNEGLSSPIRKDSGTVLKPKDKDRRKTGSKDGEEGGKGGKDDGGKGGKGDEEESEFQKWFYEHRGDTSRAWKKRRREVAKEKRQRENRRGGGGRV